jgi:hypothetical protein
MPINTIHHRSMSSQPRPALIVHHPSAQVTLMDTKDYFDAREAPVQEATPDAGQSVGRIHFAYDGRNREDWERIACVEDIQRLMDRFGIDRVVRAVAFACTVRGVHLADYIRKEEV